MELNNGQMAVDVELATKSKLPILKYNWYGGVVPSFAEVIESIKRDI
jgi:hypothetical protein